MLLSSADAIFVNGTAVDAVYSMGVKVWPFDDAMYFWHTALANVGSSQARVFYVGDSILEGTGSSVRAKRSLDLMATELVDTNPVTGYGVSEYLPAHYGMPVTITPWAPTWHDSQSGTITDYFGAMQDGYGAGTKDNTYGLGLRSSDFSTGAIRTYTVYGTDIDVWTAAGGQFQYSIDGGAYSATIDTSTQDASADITQVSGLGAGSHTVSIKCILGALHFLGFTVYDGGRDKGIVNFDACNYGSSLVDIYDWTNGSAPQNAKFVRGLTLANPHLVVLNSGINNDPTLTIAQITQQYSKLIDIVRATVPQATVVVSLVYKQFVGSTIMNTSGETIDQFYTAADAFFPSKKVPTLYLSDHMPNVYDDTTGLYQADGLHLTDAGHALMASVYEQYINPNYAVSPNPVVLTWNAASASPLAVLSAGGTVVAPSSNGTYCKVASTDELTGFVYFEIDLYGNDAVTNSTPVGGGVGTYSGTGALTNTFAGSSYYKDDVGVYLVTGNPTNSILPYFQASSLSADILSDINNVAGSTAINAHFRLGIAVSVAARKVWFRSVWTGGASAYMGGGDPTTGTSPTVTLEGTGPLYAMGSSNDSVSPVGIVSVADMVSAAPSSYSFIDGTPAAPVPMSLSGTLPGGTVGTAYTATLTISGTYVSPVTFTGQPSWMSISGTGAVTGTPTTAETEAFSIQATDSSSTPQVATSSQTIIVSAAPAFTLTGSLPAGTVGVAYSATLTLGGTYTTPVVFTGQPSWMSISSVGAATGTPTTAETDSGTITITDSNSVTATLAYSIVVSAADAYPDIVYSGSNTLAGNNNTHIPLPSGATAGQYCIVALSQDTGTYGATPSGWTVISKLTVTVDDQVFVVVGKFLDSSDITTNYAAFTGSGAVVGISAVFDNVNASAPLGAIGTGISNDNNSKPISIVAPSVTTTHDDTVQVAVFGVDAASGYASGTTLAAPSGYTKIADINISSGGYCPLMMAYMPLAATGDSGTATAIDSVDNGGWGATMITLNKVGPLAMTLSGTIPNGIVGVSYSARLALGGNFATPVVAGLSSGTLPSWMTATADTTGITYTGVPSATASAVTFTPQATDANAQVAVGPAQSVAVAAASTTFATLDSSQATYGSAISNGNLTGTFGDSSGGLSAQSECTVQSSIGNRYYEATIGNLGTTVYLGWGTSAYSGGIPGFAYSDPATSFGFESSGIMVYGQTSEGNSGVIFATGDTLGLYLAAGGGIYIRNLSGTWPTGHNPDVGGDTPLFTLRSESWRPGIGGVAPGSNQSVITVNFGATAFTGTPPIGATGWTV